MKKELGAKDGMPVLASAHQGFPVATGTGSIELARGGSELVDADTGERAGRRGGRAGQRVGRPGLGRAVRGGQLLDRRGVEPGPVERRRLDGRRLGARALVGRRLEPRPLVRRGLGPRPLVGRPVVARPVVRRRWDRARWSGSRLELAHRQFRFICRGSRTGR